MGDHRHGMTVKDLIHKKVEGGTLSKPDIEHFIQAVVDGTIDKEQIGAMLMAIRLLNMDVRETTDLTDAMVRSGEVFQWPDEWRPLLADKHSTGGVGDKVSLVLAPSLAACGLKVPMISGRALGHTGGTLDKLEAIPGFNISQSSENIHKLMAEVGCCIVGQTLHVVPADKVLYCSRDVTCTVNSLPLIVSSIISKKAAENVSSLVLDVKFGKAAFKKDVNEARELGTAMVRVSNGLGIKTTAVLTSMDAPLGYAIGNALEVAEALHCLHGEGPADLENLVVEEGALLLRSLGKAADLTEGRQKIHDVIRNGEALSRFRQMCVGQGVNPDLAERLCQRGQEFTVMTAAKHTTTIHATSSGFVHEIEPMTVARVSAAIGGARKSLTDPINHAVGVVLQCEIGTRVEKGTVVATVHHDSATLPAHLLEAMTKAIVIGEVEPPKFDRIREIIDH